MIHFIGGDLFYNVDVDALVNPVNCVGIMDKGLALQFKKRYPYNFEFYKEMCNLNKIKLGEVLTVRIGETFHEWVINFPTKLHWKNKSQMKDIEKGLVDLVRAIKQFRIESIAIPALGCGLGGLDWSAVKEKIKETLKEVSKRTEVYIYEPD